jgi:methyltransferase (TIGR00027 family)
LSDHGDDGVEQFLYYHVGVGANEGWVRRIVDGAPGIGLFRDIRTAYKWLSDHYEENSEIFVIELTLYRRNGRGFDTVYDKRRRNSLLPEPEGLLRVDRRGMIRPAVRSGRKRSMLADVVGCRRSRTDRRRARYSRKPSASRERHMNEPVIADVSDTALWIAAYRAREMDRPDALFEDRLAARLAGKRGEEIAETMGRARYMAWMIVVRTCIIDAYLKELIADGADTVLNLGAGLDTRPYRLDLPSSLRWIEVDHPNIIDLKTERLRDEKPRCVLERVSLDLADRSSRLKLFDQVAASSRTTVILTEGVIPYLSNDQVASLADDLRVAESFRYWIVDYFAPMILRLVRWGALARRHMRNAPFLFDPDDATSFFHHHRWNERETRYLVVEAEKLGRPFPKSWLAHALAAFFPAATLRTLRGYTLLVPD